MNRLAALLTGAWFGMQLMAGYIAVPILFRYLNKIMAGQIAGELFAIVAYFGLFAWAVAYVTIRTAIVEYGRYNPRTTTGLNGIGAMLLLLSINQFFVTPVIDALKHNQHHWLHDWLSGSFAVWHGVSSSIYLLCSILGGALLFYYLHFFAPKAR